MYRLEVGAYRRVAPEPRLSAANLDEFWIDAFGTRIRFLPDARDSCLSCPVTAPWQYNKPLTEWRSLLLGNPNDATTTAGPIACRSRANRTRPGAARLVAMSIFLLL